MGNYSYRCVSVDVTREEGVSLPEYALDGDACADIKAYLPHGPIELKPGEIKLIKSGIKVAIPDMYEIQIRPRSGLALKHGVTVLNSPGTIDSSYRGDVGVILVNLGTEPFLISDGDRIAQISIHKTNYIRWINVDVLSNTDRGDGSFGHTGV